jgi:hypothetical protein
MKNILSGIIILGVTMSFTPDHERVPGENGTLSVTATYRDAYTSSDQPDAGCEIYAVNQADIKSTSEVDLKSVIESFQGYKYDYLLSIYNSVDPARNAKLRTYFDTLSDFTARYISRFRKSPGITRAAPDGRGNYTMSLKPGTYYILVISGSVKSNNSAESKGNIGYKTVVIRPAQETIQHVYFQKYEMTGIMIARNLSGC